MTLREKYWERFELAELSGEEWEALCDGCALCCLHKLEDESTGQVEYTRVACEQLDLERCRCRHYGDRQRRVADCVVLEPATVAQLTWLPSSCAYRRLATGRPLPDWHPLLSGDRDAVHRHGASVRGRAIAAEFVHPDGMDEHIIHWIDRDDEH